MNNSRRKEIAKIVTTLSELQNKVCDLAAQEQEAVEGIPESLQDTDRYISMSEAAETLDYLDDSIQELIDSLETAAE